MENGITGGNSRRNLYCITMQRYKLTGCSSRIPGMNTMNGLVKSVKRFLVSEDGPTAVEYAVMLALIIVVCLTAIQAVGTNASTTFTGVSTQLGGS